MCREDILFYFNTMLYTYDNRDPKNVHPVIPFITWKFQDTAIQRIEDSIGVQDLLVEKTRDMGLSWLSMGVVEHQWHFRDRVSFLLLSRVEDLVDKSGDPDALMWKIDFFHEYLPGWLRPKMERRYLHFDQVENGSTIDGQSTTKHAGVAGRRTAIFADEFGKIDPVSKQYEIHGSTADVTNSRIFISTHLGTGTCFYEMTRPGSGIEVANRMKLLWWLHPKKAVGLYIDSRGKYRSTWYDAECKRRHPKEIAQDIDCDPQGSAWQFFEQEVLDEQQKLYVKHPTARGDLMFDRDTLKPKGFESRIGGKLKVWINLDGHGNMPGDKSYAVGVDVSMGTGASNSAICVLNRKTGEKVAEYLDPHMGPADLAQLAIAICRWCTGTDSTAGGAFLIWESNAGPGTTFSKEIIEKGYRHIYFRKDETKIGAENHDKPGWYSGKESKYLLLSEFRSALKDGLYLERSEETLTECRQFICATDQKTVMHAKAASTFDPTGAGENHGDSVIASALSWWASKTVRQAKVEDKRVIPVGSFQWRRDQLARSKRQQYVI